MRHVDVQIGDVKQKKKILRARRKYYRHNLCSVFSENNTKRRRVKGANEEKSMTQTIFHNFSMMCIHY